MHSDLQHRQHLCVQLHGIESVANTHNKQYHSLTHARPGVTKQTIIQHPIRQSNKHRAKYTSMYGRACMYVRACVCIMCVHLCKCDITDTCIHRGCKEGSSVIAQLGHSGVGHISLTNACSQRLNHPNTHRTSTAQKKKRKKE